MSFTVDVHEITALASDLSAAPGRVGALVSKVLRKTGFDIEGDAKIYAPVDTGTLEGSISTTITGSGSYGAMTVEVGPTAEYGDFVERGTSVMAAQPYMAPAFDRRVPPMETALAAAAVQGLT